MRGLPDAEWHIAEMKRLWPGFSVVARDGVVVSWRGTLKPLFRTFTVAVSYRVPLAVELLEARRFQPQVRVADPPLRPRRGDPEGALPHVYYTGPGETDVVLCMLDPDAGEWDPNLSLAETTIPWTVDWLASYEGWRATGKWTGGGRHPEAAPPVKVMT